MTKNQKILIGSFAIILTILIGNSIYQSKKIEKVKPTLRKRKSLLMDRQVIDNLMMAKTKDPRFVERVGKEYKTKKLVGRKLMVYAEKLGTFNTEKSVALMREIYNTTQDIKVKNRIVKGLGLASGGENQKFLMELFNKRSELVDLEKVYLYNSVALSAHDATIKKEMNKFFLSHLNFNDNLLNFLSLRFFMTFKVKQQKVISFSHEVLQKALNEENFSPALFSGAIHYLTNFDIEYLKSYHSRFMKKLPKRFTGFYLNLVHRFCPTTVVDDLMKLVNDSSVSFDIFRVAAAEVKLFGGKKIFNLLERASKSSSLNNKRREFLTVLISKYGNMGEQKLCHP